MKDGKHQEAASALMDWLQMTLLKDRRADFEASRDHPSRRRSLDGDFTRGIVGDDLEDAPAELGQRVLECCWGISGDGLALAEAVVEKARGLVVKEADPQKKRGFMEQWHKCMPLEKAQPLLTSLNLFDLLLGRLEDAQKRVKAAALASVMGQHQRAANQLHQFEGVFYKACRQQELLLAGQKLDNWTKAACNGNCEQGSELQKRLLCVPSELLKALELTGGCMRCKEALVLAKSYSYLMVQEGCHKDLAIKACADGLDLLQRLIELRGKDFESLKGHPAAK